MWCLNVILNSKKVTDKFCLNLSNQMRKYMYIIQDKIVLFSYAVIRIHHPHTSLPPLWSHNFHKQILISGSCKVQYMWVEAFFHSVTQTSRFSPSRVLSPEHMASSQTREPQISSGYFLRAWPANDCYYLYLHWPELHQISPISL